MDKMKKNKKDSSRINVPENLKKHLISVSGNQCAFPSCEHTFYSHDRKTHVAEICHIEAVSKGGARYNPSLTKSEVNKFENLILLCRNCHKIVDSDVYKYTPEVLRGYKKEHESKIERIFIKNSDYENQTSAINELVKILGETLFEVSHSNDPSQAHNIEKKISFNNIIKYSTIINKYVAYQNILNKSYEEIEKHGSLRKNFILMNINDFYLKEKSKYSDDTLKGNADIIIDDIKEEIFKIIDSTKNKPIFHYETINVCVLIIMVDAFIRCQILEEPL
jgi:hypothetical protein